MEEHKIICPYKCCGKEFGNVFFNEHILESVHEDLGEIDCKYFENGVLKVFFSVPSKIRLQELEPNFLLDFSSSESYEWKLVRIPELPLFLGNFSNYFYNDVCNSNNKFMINKVDHF